MRKWTHVQKLRRKMGQPVPDDRSYIPEGGRGFGRSKRLKNKTRIPPNYHYLLRFASQYPAEIEWHLKAAVPRIWSSVEHWTKSYHVKTPPEKVFRLVLAEHLRVMKVMKKWAHIDDVKSRPETYRGLTEKQREKKYDEFWRQRGELQHKVYRAFYDPPASLVKLMGPTKALEFWKSIGHTIFVPDWDSVYRWMDSYRRE
jgi:hypothetical protein